MNTIDPLQVLESSLSHDKTVAILGCGSPLRGDDAVGVAVAQRLAATFGEANSRVCAFNGDVAPENQTGAIKQCNPDVVLIIDALDMGLEPGELRVVLQEEVDGVSFSTHMLPLPILMDYLRRETGCEVLLIGIQAASLDFLSEMTPAVATAADTLTTTLLNLLL